MQDQVKGRRYDNSSRRRGSAITRTRILDAARTLLISEGYRATTVAAIARDAGTHVDTVYELVGRKPMIVRTLVEASISGGDGAVPADERDYVRRIKAALGARAKLSTYTKALAVVHSRLAPLFEALRDAAATEPEAAEIWRSISTRRAKNMHEFAADLRSTGELRTDLTDEEVADIVWATNSPELYLLLVRDRAWSPDRYEAWLTDAWERTLLAVPQR